MFVVLVGVVLVSAGTLTISTHGTDSDGTLLRAQWSQGCVDHPDLVASHVGPNQCDPQRLPSSAHYCRLDSDGTGPVAQNCRLPNGCPCNSNWIDYNLPAEYEKYSCNTFTGLCGECEDGCEELTCGLTQSCSTP